MPLILAIILLLVIPIYESSSTDFEERLAAL
jgi:hypothetical protein